MRRPRACLYYAGLGQLRTRPSGSPELPSSGHLQFEGYRGASSTLLAYRPSRSHPMLIVFQQRPGLGVQDIAYGDADEIRLDTIARSLAYSRAAFKGFCLLAPAVSDFFEVTVERFIKLSAGYFLVSVLRA